MDNPGEDNPSLQYESRCTDVVTFKSSWCRPRYFKNCIRRKCESSSIPTSAKRRWGDWNSTPRDRILTRGRGSASWGRGSTPQPLRQFEHWLEHRSGSYTDKGVLWITLNYCYVMWCWPWNKILTKSLDTDKVVDVFGENQRVFNHYVLFQ